MSTIAELMNHDTPQLNPYSTLEEASAAMDQSKMDSLPLCDPQGCLIGVVTRSGISRAFRSLGELAGSLRAQHLMHSDAPSIGIHDTLEQAMAQMAIHQTQHLPVLNGPTVEGMLTSAAIAQAGPRVCIEELIHHVSLPADRDSPIAPRSVRELNPVPTKKGEEPATGGRRRTA